MPALMSMVKHDRKDSWMTPDKLKTACGTCLDRNGPCSSRNTIKVSLIGKPIKTTKLASPPTHGLALIKRREPSEEARRSSKESPTAATVVVGSRCIIKGITRPRV